MKKLERRVQKVNGESVGLDVHQKIIAFSRLDRRGDEVASGTFPANEDRLRAFLKEHVGRRQSHIALEASGGMLWVYDVLVEKYGLERIHVAQSRRIHAIANSQEKNDANDAWWLAYLTHEGRLPECFIPRGALRELRIATRTRQALVVLRTRLIVQLRSHLRQGGIRLPCVTFGSAVNQALLHELARRGSDATAAAIRTDLALIGHIDEDIRAWDGRIQELSKSFAEVRVLQNEIPGVGPLLAAVIVAESGPMERFRTAKAYGRYTGLTPAARSTGGRMIHGGITRQGSPHLRRALGQATVACCRIQRGRATCVRGWIEAKYRRLGNRAKAKSAAARKLAQGIWRLLALGECFDVTKPFGPASSLKALE